MTPPLSINGARFLQTTLCVRAHAIKKRQVSRDARMNPAMSSYTIYVGIVWTVLGNAVREASPRAAQVDGRRAVGVSFALTCRNQRA